MTDLEILALISRIQHVEYEEDELSGLLDQLKIVTKCPTISDIIFYGEDGDTPEKILRKAREYRPFQL